MGEGFSDPFRALADAFLHLLRQEPALRSAARGVAEALLRELARLDAAAPSAPAEPSSPAIEPVSPATRPSPVQPAQAMKLHIGDAEIEVQARVSPEEASAARWAPRPAATNAPSGTISSSAQRSSDLSLLARRARLKGEACRWAAQRRRLLGAGADRDGVAARDRDFFADAKTINCYLWMMDPGGPLLPSDDATLDELAGCYDALAAAADLLVQVDQQRDRDATDFERDAFDLAAQAQSALRVALEQVDRLLVDADQDEMFWWLRTEASESRRGILIVRHMRRDDLADPAQWLALLERIEALRGQVDARRQQESERRRLLGKVRYHTERIRKNSGGNASEADWSAVESAVEALLAGGLPPSDREVRERLLPVMDELPERQFAPAMTAVVGEIDRYLEQVDRDPQQAAPRPPSSTLLAAREMLRGKVAVLLGGYPREQLRRKIELAFELAELRWLSVGHGQNLEQEMLPQFRRYETRVFIVMTRFRSHQFGPQVREWCRQFGKVFVELPGGYGIEQIAHQVAQQVNPQTL